MCAHIHKVAHETMHALGFRHEQERADRDDYLQVFMENVQENVRGPYQALKREWWKDLGVPFDILSVTLYASGEFGIGGKVN